MMNSSPVDFQSCVVWGPDPQVAVLKTGLLDMCPKLFTSQGVASQLGVPSQLYGVGPRMGFMVRVSQPFLPTVM